MIQKMMNGNLRRSPSRFRGFKYYMACRRYRRPYLVNLELTKHCNAKCGFCACWQLESPNELKDYSPVIKKLRPVVVSVSGGEPLLRRGHMDLLRGIRQHCHYMILITNAGLLDVDVADSLSEVGLNQLAISLDYEDDTHDTVRVIPGLYKRIEKLVPQLTSKGYKVFLNTIIMEANLDHIVPLIHKAKAWGAGISLSTYCPLKRSSDDLMVSPANFKRLEELVSEIKSLKKSLGHIKNSNYYLNGIVKYFRTGGGGSCKAGKNWVQVTPDGYIQPCSELPRILKYDEYERAKVPKITCTKCWYTCRGESEAPHLSPDRLLELVQA